jgi:hypothetical protein
MPVVSFKNTLDVPLFLHCLIGAASIPCHERPVQRNIYLLAGDTHEESIGPAISICFAYSLDDQAFDMEVRCIARPSDLINLDGSHHCFVTQRRDRSTVEEFNPWALCVEPALCDGLPKAEQTDREFLSAVLSALYIVSEIYKNFHSGNLGNLDKALAGINEALSRIELRLAKVELQLEQVINLLRNLPKEVAGEIRKDDVNAAIGRIKARSDDFRNFIKQGFPKTGLTIVRQSMSDVNADIGEIEGRLNGVNAAFLTTPLFATWLSGCASYVAAMRNHYPEDNTPDPHLWVENDKARERMGSLFVLVENEKLRIERQEIPHTPIYSGRKRKRYYTFERGKFQFYADNPPFTTPGPGHYQVTCPGTNGILLPRLQYWDGTSWKDSTGGQEFEEWQKKSAFKDQLLRFKDVCIDFLPNKDAVMQGFDRPPEPPNRFSHFRSRS